MVFAIHLHESAMGAHVLPNPEVPSHLPPHLIPLGWPRAPTLSALLHALNLHWSSVLHVSMLFSQIIPPSPSPTKLKSLFLHLCLFCCFAYRIVITVFLNSIYIYIHTYIYINILYWCFSFWLTSLFIIGSSFIHLIRGALELIQMHSF